MKTFENLQQEIPTQKECFTSWGRTHGFDQIRNEMIQKVTRLPLHVRISLRGKVEQYNVRFLSNYHQDQKKRTARAFTATVNNMC